MLDVSLSFGITIFNKADKNLCSQEAHTGPCWMVISFMERKKVGRGHSVVGRCDLKQGGQGRPH